MGQHVDADAICAQRRGGDRLRPAGRVGRRSAATRHGPRGVQILVAGRAGPGVRRPRVRGGPLRPAGRRGIHPDAGYREQQPVRRAGPQAGGLLLRGHDRRRGRRAGRARLGTGAHFRRLARRDHRPAHRAPPPGPGAQRGVGHGHAQRCGRHQGRALCAPRHAGQTVPDQGPRRPGRRHPAVPGARPRGRLPRLPLRRTRRPGMDRTRGRQRAPGHEGAKPAGRRPLARPEAPRAAQARPRPARRPGPHPARQRGPGHRESH